MADPLLRQVKASAGSGKTHDLTGRFLQHLAATAPRAHAPSCGIRSTAGWGDVLAVTFTNSAAAEMKERVLRRLKGAALGHENLEGMNAAQATQWVDIILRQYGALNIRTIDSLLHLVVRTAALDLGLPPDFETTFATEETLLPIFDALLEKAWQGDENVQTLLTAVCRSLLYHAEAKGFTVGERILKALAPLLELALLRQYGEALPPLSPLIQVEAAYRDIQEAFIRLGALMKHHMAEEKLVGRKYVSEAFAACAEGKIKGAESAFLSKNDLDECLHKASVGKASPEAQRTYTLLTEVAETFRSRGSILRRALELAPFAELADVVAQGLEEHQQGEGKTPGAIIPLLARQVLDLEHGVPSALCRLGSSLNHMLMDEFQDTSRVQWQALHPLVTEALSRGGSLTWVGDIKQAIYGWRGGDAALFDDILHDPSLLCIAPQPACEQLPTNWRSREVIVQHNNAFFAPLENTQLCLEVLAAMLSNDCPPQVLASAATRLARTFTSATQQSRPQGAEGGFVTLREVRAEVAEELDEAVKEALSQRLHDDVLLRHSFGDITVLVRSNKEAAKVAAWLMEWQVPVITENSLLLSAHPLVAETLALLSFLDCPQDDLNFWTVLTGSVLAPCLGQHDATEFANGQVAPSLEYLRHWALLPRKGFMCTAVREQWPTFWQHCFAPFHGKAGLMSPYDIVQEWYRLMRVPQRFPEASTFVRRFLEILHTAGERGSATLSTFLEYWQHNGGDEKAPMPSGMDAVRIMTIHKSKGLQFPVVIVPWMSFGQKSDNPPVVHDLGDLRVLAPRCKEMGEIHYQAQAQQALEALNLLYVACTRAEEELHLFHTHTPYYLRMRNLASGIETLLPAVGFDLPYSVGRPSEGKASQSYCSPEFALPTGDTTELPPEHQGLLPPSLQDLKEEDEEWRPMHWLPRLKIFRNPLKELTFTGKRRGMLTHHCLELFQSTGAPAEDAARAVQLGLRTFSLPVPHSDALREELVRSLTWFASLPGARHWTEQGLPEQSLLDAKGALHRVDLLIPPFHDHAPWRAIDYKTGAEETEHLVQIRRYLGLLDALPSNLEKHTPSQGMLVYLDLQRCRMVDEHSVSDLLSAPSWDCENA